MYKVPEFIKSRMSSVDVLEGETIERKIERIVSNKEPITDGAPEIFTERSEGVISAYNIRTDRWEIAVDAMDAIDRNIVAKREAKAKERYDNSEEGKKAAAEASAKVEKAKADAEAKVVMVKVVGNESTQGQLEAS